MGSNSDEGTLQGTRDLVGLEGLEEHARGTQGVELLNRRATEADFGVGVVVLAGNQHEVEVGAKRAVGDVHGGGTGDQLSDERFVHLVVFLPRPAKGVTDKSCQNPRVRTALSCTPEVLS